jgi:hypothetical protein
MSTVRVGGTCRDEEKRANITRRDMKKKIILTLVAAALALAAIPAIAGVASVPMYLTTSTAVEAAKQFRRFMIRERIREYAWSDWHGRPLQPRRVNSRLVDVRVHIEVYTEGPDLDDYTDGESASFWLRVRRIRHPDGSTSTWSYNRSNPYGGVDGLPWRPL